MNSRSIRASCTTGRRPLAHGTTSELTPPVIVLGMHRSGTSLVTGRLEAAGVYLGQVNTAAGNNAKGNRENEALRQVHDAMITDRGFDWKTPPDGPIAWTESETTAILEQLAPYAGKPIWGFKDPRSLWLLDGYLDLFPDARLIAPVRHPASVAKSLNARPKSLSLSLDEGRRLWRVTNEALLRVRDSHPLTLLRFSDLGVEDPLFSGPFDAFLHSHGLTIDAPEFYDRDLVHQTDLALDLDREDLDLWQRLLEAVQAQ
ncbi:sulfotransferase [Jannaschia sp.]|nr:sulfotransferase [Jannaschia sp.]